MEIVEKIINWISLNYSGLLIGLIPAFIMFILGNKKDKNLLVKDDYKTFSDSVNTLKYEILKQRLYINKALENIDEGAIDYYLTLTSLIDDAKTKLSNLNYFTKEWNLYNILFSNAIPLYTETLGQFRYYYKKNKALNYYDKEIELYKKNLLNILIDLEKIIEIHNEYYRDFNYKSSNNPISDKQYNKLKEIEKSLHRTVHSNMLIQHIMFVLAIANENAYLFLKPEEKLQKKILLNIPNKEQLLEELLCIYDDEDSYSSSFKELRKFTELLMERIKENIKINIYSTDCIEE